MQFTPAQRTLLRFVPFGFAFARLGTHKKRRSLENFGSWNEFWLQFQVMGSFLSVSGSLRKMFLSTMTSIFKDVLIETRGGSSELLPVYGSGFQIAPFRSQQRDNVFLTASPFSSWGL